MPSPSGRSSLIRWLDAGAATGQSNGQPFTGTLAGFAAPDSGSRPVYRANGFQGRPAIDFSTNASAVLSLSSASDLDAMQAGDYTITIVFRLDDVSGFQSLFAQAPGGNCRLWWLTQDAQIRRYSDFGGTPVLLAGVPYVYQYVFARIDAGNGTETEYLNGFRWGVRTGSIPAPVASPYTVGGPFWAPKGVIAQVLVDNVALSSGTLQDDRDYLSSLYRSGVTVLCSGDSRTFGVDTERAANTSPYPYPSQLQALLGGVARVVNYGRGGTTAADHLTLFPGEVPPETIFANVIPVFWSGVNDLGGGTPGAVADNFVTLDGLYEAAGLRRIVCTDADWVTSDPTTSESTRASLNALIRSNLPTAGRRVSLDLAADSRIGLAATCNDHSLFCLDTIHMHGDDGTGPPGNPGGAYQIVAELVYAAILPVIAALSDATPPTTPGTPSPLTAPATLTVSLAWAASTDPDDDPSVLVYRIYRDGGGSPVGTVTGATTWSETVAATGDTHTYQVDARDPAGNASAKSAAASVRYSAGGGGFRVNFDGGF